MLPLFDFNPRYYGFSGGISFLLGKHLFGKEKIKLFDTLAIYGAGMTGMLKDNDHKLMNSCIVFSPFAPKDPIYRRSFKSQLLILLFTSISPN